jgi:Short C-terminal domain
MRIRRIGVAALLVVGTLFWTAFGFALWAHRQALDTENWVNTSSELLEDEEIRTTLALFIVDRLYDSEAVEARIEEALPPRLDPLSGPAAAGLKEVARRTAPRLLGSQAALQAWETANEAAHATLIRVVEGDVASGEVNLDLGTLFAQVASATGLPPDAVDRLPPEVSSLQIASGDNLETAQDMLDLFKAVAWILLVLALAAFAGALALSRDRRRTAVTIGGCLILAGIAIVAVRRLAGDAVVNALADAPNAAAVSDDVWDIATSLMVDAAQGSVLFGLFVVTGGWLVGPGRRATAIRRASAQPLREHAGLVRAGLGAAILLLVIWGPVPWTQRLWGIAIFTVLAFVWLERIRRRTLAEFPDQPAPRISLRRRNGRVGELERLETLRARGVLDQAEFEREKAALLASG